MSSIGDFLKTKPKVAAASKSSAFTDDVVMINSRTAFFKRVMDLTLSSLALLLLAPLFPLIAFAIKLESKGPVFFKQMRIGRAMPDRTDIFYMIKFRSMVQDAESKSGAVWAVKNDPRVTRVGLFLRKTRLDELPQLWNVAKGEMSLIGPRPERPGFYQNLEKEIPFFAERTYGILPGITGLAQVRQGYDTSIDDVRNKVGYDHSYVLSLCSLRTWVKMDTFIILETLRVMFFAKGQ